MSSPVLVGRSGQLSALESALARVSRGGPSAVMVGGEAGVGKSRLVNEFAGRSRGAGARVLMGGCLELGADGLPFAPFTSVLRGLVRDLGAAGVAGLLPGGSATELARLLPEFGEPASPGDGGEARARLFEQVLVLLERLAEAGPVVLVVEDMHWADRSSRDLLAFLIRNQPSAEGVLIVVTFRSDDLDQVHPLRPLLAELGRIDWVARMDLGRLTRSETGRLAAQITGRALDDDLLAAVYRRSQGNPLFVEALLGDGEPGSGLPESLRDLLVAAVRRLPEQTQEVVRVASAGGDRIGHGLLAAVTGLEDTALARALRPAVAANVLLVGSDGYVFRHALIREAMHDELLPGERGQVHRQFAEVIGADPALVAPGRAAGEQSWHWYAAHDTARALVSAWQAAGQAARALAYAEQLAMVSRVLELWEQVPDAAQRIGASYLSVLESAVEAALAAGEDERGIGFATAALQEIDVVGEPARAALMLKARARMRWHLGLARGNEDVREALRLVPAGSPGPARGQVLSWLASRLDTSGEPGARAAAEEALQASRQAGDAETEAHVLITLAELDSSERGALSLDMLEQARELGEQAQNHDVLLRVAIIESHMLEGVGEHERAAQVARQGAASAREYGLARTTGALLAANAAEPLVSLGRWDEAADVIEHALEMSPPLGTRAALLVLAGEVALARGDPARAAESAEASHGALAGAGYRDQNHLPLARLEAELCLSQDRAGDALTVTEEALSRFELAHSPRYAWPLVATGARACVAAPTAAAARHPELAGRARVLLDRLRAQAEKMGAAGPLQHAHRLTFAAEAARAGQALASTGHGEPPQPSDMRAAWDEAAHAWEAVGEPYPLAVTLLRSAETALGAGDRDGGATRLRRAADLARKVGARPLSDDIALLARRARITLDQPGDTAGTQAAAGRAGPTEIPEPDRMGLTARELDVLRLVAAGRSNRGIADELFISVKTASVHVSNILGKLGVTGRGEAAAAAHRLRLLDSFPA
ncbi:MAG TPA: AAA family ATPase [Streptosporangiaceae bacterium]|nr:AAA family ATPase [Streptosporangiaceae bacterium]